MRRPLFLAAALLLPALARADEIPGKLVYDKGLAYTTDDESFELKVGLRSQMRFETIHELSDNDEWDTRFLLPRTRLIMEGHAFKTVGYKMEFGLGERGNSFLKDMYVNLEIAKGVQFRAGQWKRPFNRQEI